MLLKTTTTDSKIFFHDLLKFPVSVLLSDSNMILTPSAEESEVRTSFYNIFLGDFLLKLYPVAIHALRLLP